MKSNVVFRWAARDAWGARRLLLWPAICIFIATFCFQSLHRISGEIETTVIEQAQELSGGDLDLSGPHAFTTEQMKVVSDQLNHENIQKLAEANTIEFLSMMVPTDLNAHHSRLVEVHATSPTFPLYGKMVVEKEASPIESGAASTTKRTIPGTWHPIRMSAELRHLVGTDHVRIGTADFEATEDIAEEPGGSLSPFPIAPHVWIAIADAEKTGLLQTGSRIRYRLLFRLNRIPDFDFVKSLRAQLHDDRIQIHTATSSSSQIEKLFDRVFRFSRLSSLLAMTLALLASGIGLRIMNHQQVRTRTTLRLLGLNQKQIRLWSSAQTFLLAATALAGGWLFSLWSEPFFTHALAVRFHFKMDANISVAQELALFGLFSILMSGLFVLQNSNRIYLRAVSLPVILFSTVLLVQDWRWGLGFWAVVIVTTLIFRLHTRALLYALDRFLLDGKFGTLIVGALRVRLLSLVRYPQMIATGMSGIGLGLFLVFSLLIFRDSLMSELSTVDQPSSPSLFLIDVGTDQKDAIDQILKNAKMEASWSRFVKARLLTVNGSTPNEVPDEERLHREFNLNDRAKLDPSESLIDGHWWTGVASADAQLLEASVEVGFASRMGLKIGDHVRFDLQGVSFETVITSIRRVDWTSFHPNFFFLIQPGFLDGAPQTWVAALSSQVASGTAAPANSSAGSLLELQDRIVTAEPNVSVIDLAQTLSRVKSLIHSIELVLTSLCTLILSAGLLLLISSLLELSHLREGETALLRALGVDQRKLSHANLVEGLTWAIFILVIGVPLSILTMWSFIHFIFQGEVELFTSLQFQVAGGFLLFVLILTAIVQRRTRNESPLKLLRAN